MSDIRDAVRQEYGRIAVESSEPQGASCCAPSCCAPAPDEQSQRLGYSKEEVASVPEGANLGLGCGNPQAIAALQPGETVLDLGSGAGFDCFLAAQQVGPTGRVIGVDMTPQMLSKARQNAAKVEAANIEFRLGEIEHLPVADASVDVILSNCVINLSPDKGAVYREAFRVLKPGGRLAISDVVATAPLPEAVRNDLKAYTGCVAGAMEIRALEALLTEVGFTDVSVSAKKSSREVIREWIPGGNLEDYVVSAAIEATRPNP